MIERGEILLVEDNPDDVELTARALRHNKVYQRLEVVGDGEQALEYIFKTGRYADSSHEMPLLVLLDLHLPKVDGLEVLRRIRADSATQALPVVILTTSSQQQDILQSYRLGANSYVRKPVEFSEFVEAVGRLGFYWLAINVPSDSTLCAA